MTENEIINNNLLIAAFMGHKIYHSQAEILYDGTYPEVEKFWSNGGKMNNYGHYEVNTPGKAIWQHNLLYHESWAWLMPVVKACVEVGGSWEHETDQRDRFEVIFDVDYMWMDFIDNDVTSIYERVVEFIKFYRGEE